MWSKPWEPENWVNCTGPMKKEPAEEQSQEKGTRNGGMWEGDTKGGERERENELRSQKLVPSFLAAQGNASSDM